MPIFDPENPWWDEEGAEDVSDSVRGILQDRIEEESVSEEEEQRDLVELEELDEEEIAEEVEEEDEEEIAEEAEEEGEGDLEPADLVELPENLLLESPGPLVATFDSYEDAYNFAHKYPGVFEIVVNEEGEFEAHRNYGSENAVA